MSMLVVVSELVAAKRRSIFQITYNHEILRDGLGTIGYSAIR